MKFEGIVTSTMGEPEAASGDELVLLRDVKGNLRHRIDKCGIGLPSSHDATAAQRRLRQVALDQELHHCCRSA